MAVNVYGDKIFHDGVGPSTGILPNRVLGTDATGDAVYYHAPYYDFIVNNQGLINQTTTLQTHTTLSATIPEDGLYEVKWFYTWSLNDAAQDFIAEVLIDGVALDPEEHRQEPKDSAGTGPSLPIVGGGSIATGTNQKHKVSGFSPVNLLSSNNPIDIEVRWAGSATSDRATIYNCNISIERKG